MRLHANRIWPVLIGLILLNVLSAFVYTRIDLTADRRYTLSDGTRALLTSLPQQVHIDVFLTGDLPPGFKRLETAIQENLEESEAIAGARLSYRFVNPLSGSKTEQEQRLTKLAELGLQPTNLFANEGGTRTEQLIVPGAVVSYAGKQVGVLLLKGNKAATPAEQLNQSYEGVEYQLSSAIRRITQPVGSRRRVGLLFGHTQVPPERFSDLLATIQETYDLFLADLSKPGPLTDLDALLVLKPDRPFSEQEVYKIDQYVVNGGHALFFVDGQRVDSVSRDGTFAQPLDLGLNDLFFRWGARVNQNVVKDLSCAVIPLNVGNIGDKPNVQLVPWRFYPVLNSFGSSPITRNIDALYSRFISTLDTVQALGIRKTVLVQTSPYTSVLKVPALIAYNEARQQPDPKTYTSGTRLVSALFEGAFSSVFANQILPDSLAKTFRATGKPGGILICADGDLVVNDVDYKRKTPLPLGYDRFTRNQFANKDFVLNALDYLTDPNGVIAARARVVPLRPLDAIRVKAERVYWQGLNVLGPLVLVALVGLCWTFVRRRTYGRNA
ncbi:gliding motility-associated ABC transporter substrate-binding protein GldG [Fibrella sp. HMF5335]|uniref:Gliding motility-associated ABC transporter substrate-binding protein GldG n=1 Tax=Fibrella rubiginis TaxID=2817060 RepID=A0A939GIT1_9BACT|nr:gliding motility-associated ABC transporter substrate-binding protein GldG [Fibrella rubiginis]MBO0937545.1 gliding motility-associated ABC transporter substrate-binding protein GldG [Fibrella rubiginis]